MVVVLTRGDEMSTIKIPVEEAIYYLEDVLRDSVKLFACVRCEAPIMMEWAQKVNNILRTVYGDSSEENMKFCSQRFEGDEKRVIEVIAFSTGLLRDCVRKLKRAISVNSFSRGCFVAMWFDPSMEDVYQCGIYKPLKDIGFNPIRVDKIEHNDRIDHVIFDLIRRSRFVVADFTGNRAGVYYESGFASGLGLPVIHTCRRDSFEGRHFDVLTINTIVYDTAEALANDLRRRVLETIS